MTAPNPKVGHEGRFLAAALGYASNGWFVFPLIPGGKLPAIPESEGGQGFKDATRNEKQIREWWTRCPTANIGLWPGASGLTGFDLDGPEGEETAQRIGLLREPTLTCTSGREDGGRHLYFKSPGFPVSNAKIGKKLDVRGQNGYLILPPSIHPSGRQYRWAGKDQIAELPAAVVKLLRDGSDTDATGPREPVVTGAPIPDGERNNELTRVAGNLLVKHPIPAAKELLWAYNVANCKPPKSRDVTDGIIANLSTKEGKKKTPSRLTDTGHVLTVGAPTPEPEMPLPLDLSIMHTEGAIAETRADHSDAPRWEWPDLHDLVGPMLPGYFVVAGALPGGGKTSLLLSELDYCAREEIPAVYMPLEVNPPTMMRKRAAWSLGFDWEHVVRNDWSRLPARAQEQIEAKICEHGKQGHIQMPPDKKLTLAGLERWVKWGIREIGARVVFVDHIHRTDVGGSAEGHRINFTDAIRAVKDLGREHGVAIVAAAHLNRNSDLFDKYSPPHLGRLKETSALAEEADYVLMLSRKLRQAAISPEDVEAIRMGQREIRDFADENVMVVTCRKHRVIDSANDRSVKLLVQDGHVRSLYQGPVRP